MNWNLNATILYNRMFGKHGINATVGLNMMDNYSSSKSEAYRGFPSEDMSETTYAYEITVNLARRKLLPGYADSWDC